MYKATISENQSAIMSYHFVSSLCTNYTYSIVESVSFVLLRDVYPINPKRIIEIINSRDVYIYIP